MKIPRRRFLHVAAGAAALSGVSRIAWAQNYPSRSITMVVPFPAGGGTDIIARALAERMRVSLGRSIIIENVGGGNGKIGVGRVARAASDGYTIILGTWGAFVANGALYSLTYDLVRDFEPVAPVTAQPYMIVAKRSMPGDDLKGLIAWLRANPGKASAGTQGAGGSSQIGGILFQNATATHFQFVPYRGGAPAIQDLVAGQIDLMIASAGDAIAQVRAGNIKAYAVMAKHRLGVMPVVPTVDEAGLPGAYFSGWFGLWTSARTPKDIVAKLNAAVRDSLADSTVGARLAEIGQEVFPSDRQTPEALAALLKAEIEKWWPIIKAAGIKGE
jgi:tripartite-type tricarboxylate transporter receptor subunit TctC